jgi:hypothetical protein
MLLTTFVLISIDREHHGLQKRIDFGHCNQTAEVSDMSRLRLEQEEQIPVFLCLLVIREETLLYICSIVKMICNLILLQPNPLTCVAQPEGLPALTSSRAMRFCMSRAIRESKYRTSFSRTKFFFDCADIFVFRSRRIFCAVDCQYVTPLGRPPKNTRITFCQVIFNFHVPIVRGHGKV